MGLVKKDKKKKKTRITQPAKKAKKPVVVYETKIDDILKYITQEQKITFDDLSIEVDLPLDEIETWLKILEKQGLVHLNYPMMGKPYATTKNHTELPEEIAQQDNKNRNLLLFGIASAIIIIISYYIFFIRA